MQIFSRDPLQWRKAKLGSSDFRAVQECRRNSGIEKVFIHIPYLINLASPYNILYKGSIRAFIQDMQEAQLLGFEYIVTHMGSHKESGEKKGLKRVTDALNKILERTKESPVQILLENTSGAGSWLGYSFEHQRKVIDGLEQKNRIGVCFDTCHAYTAGYDLATESGYKETIEKLDKIVGLLRLKLVHLNDTRDKFGSHKDRHEHIGRGQIGLEGFKRIINDTRLEKASFILETPKDNETADSRNLETVRRLKR
jgi:deoxyribonuclease-4